MRKPKTHKDELQLDFNFMDTDSVTDVNREVSNPPASPRNQKLPNLPKNKELGLFQKIDILLRQIGNSQMSSGTKLYDFVFRSFYIEGNSVGETHQMLLDGVAGLTCVTRERVRMLVAEARDEILSLSPSRKIIKSVRLRQEIVDEMNDYAYNHIGEVLKDSKVLNSRRLGTIAYILHKKIVEGDTVLTCFKNQKILIDENVDMSYFKAHYAGLFYLLQRSVRPMTYEDIMRLFPEQRQMKDKEIREDLVRIILQHDDVFEEIADNVFRLREEHLNVTQRLARIIFDEKEVTATYLQKTYTERYGESFSSLAAVGKIYPWCVPLGRSKWLYREDGQRLRMPAEVIRDFCKEHIRFTLDEVNEHLKSQSINIKEASIRCYILRDCRPSNTDGNLFCLDSAISEADDKLWRTRSTIVTRSCNKEWKKKMESKVRRLLKSAPSHKMLQKEVLHQCRYILEQQGIAYNNFYKIVNSLPWVKSTTIDGKTYLELNRKN